jgi:hypothetical protein
VWRKSYAYQLKIRDLEVTKHKEIMTKEDEKTVKANTIT